MNAVKYAVIIAFIILLLVIGIKQQIDINTLNKDIAALEKKRDEMVYNNDKKQNELDTPSDDMMEKYAQDNGYKDPDAQYFYNDFNG